jgi:hypothetical protein
MSRNYRFQAITERSADGSFNAKVIIGNFASEAEAKEICRLFVCFIYSIASEVSEGREFDESIH